MKLPTSDKTSSFVKPHIKKGYYPGQLLKVEEFKDKEGNLKVGKFGLQLIFHFAVYNSDPKTDEPTEPVLFQTSEKVNENVIIQKFVYHMYKKKGANGKFIEGEYQTAITPNSAITKLLKALGWEFSADGVEMDDFVGKWAELNIDDYEYGEGADAKVASTINNVNPYKGPEVKNIKKVKAP